ncbi:CaiB/BaiF CoA transferase family protein [Ruegeria atlantica]|uniref:CaiB/BaiF CoA transferase family protein n=1 Tax=Ruegeria atlantica TaxID=81569 RepID=UPI002493FD45|nr:CoA transferase [Ruegeria atlantica]
MYDLLKGVRVLDLTAVVLGPLATQYLGDFGADVIKVEPPSGDIFRQVRPARSDAMGAGYLNYNRNKRSVSLNLKREEDREQFMTLLAEADVLVHNMRPGAAKRLGLDPDTISNAFPSLVYCVAAGYGSMGRNSEHPAYDDIIQAASGVAHLNRNQNDEPRFLPTIICDKVGGMHLAMAVLAGIAHQAKTGQGCIVEAPMFEGLVAFLMSEQLSGETFRPAKGSVGYERLLSPHRKPFPTKDGFVGVLPYNGKHWASFLNFVGRGDLAQADWVQDSAARSENIGKLYAIVAEKMPERTTADWLEVLRDLDIPCTPINSLTDLLEDDHLSDVELFREIEHPSEGKLRSIRSPFWVQGADEHPDAPAPKLAAPGEAIAWWQRK